jgi:hypothetical protein
VTCCVTVLKAIQKCSIVFMKVDRGTCCGILFSQWAKWAVHKWTWLKVAHMNSCRCKRGRGSYCSSWGWFQGFVSSCAGAANVWGQWVSHVTVQ